MSEISEQAKLKACDATRARELLVYDPDTGSFCWRVSRGRARAGQVAGTVNPIGYRQINFDGQYHYAHRLAWLIAHGQMPEGMIDHVNGERDDNRLANLRIASRVLNQQNRRGAQANNKTGLLGVSFCKRTKRYRAQISAGGHVRSLGYHDTPEAASAAYQLAKRQFHPETIR